MSFSNRITNLTKESVLAAMSFYKIVPGDIAVIHDELDLRPGKVRVKRGGGSAGHSGLRSIDAMIGADYWRVRIGIGHPGIKELAQPYVLQNYPPDEIRFIEKLVDAVAETIPLLLGGAPDAFLGQRINPPGIDIARQRRPALGGTVQTLQKADHGRLAEAGNADLARHLCRFFRRMISPQQVLRGYRRHIASGRRSGGRIRAVIGPQQVFCGDLR